MTDFDERLERVVDRYNDLAARLANTQAAIPENFAQLSKEYAELATVVQAIDSLRKTKAEIAELEQMADDPEGDPEMRDLARAEMSELKRTLPELQHRLQVLLLPKDL